MNSLNSVKVISEKLQWTKIPKGHFPLKFFSEDWLFDICKKVFCWNYLDQFCIFKRMILSKTILIEQLFVCSQKEAF